jgi:hypothetical protein
MFGDFLSALLIFASIISMVEIKFSFQSSPKKRSKMKFKVSLKCKCNGAKSLGVKAADH